MKQHPFMSSTVSLIVRLWWYTNRTCLFPVSMFSYSDDYQCKQRGSWFSGLLTLRIWEISRPFPAKIFNPSGEISLSHIDTHYELLYSLTIPGVTMTLHTWDSHVILQVSTINIRLRNLIPEDGYDFETLDETSIAERNDILMISEW